MLVVPDNILEQLICDECHKYLSVNVVTIINIGGTCKKVCGRCKPRNKRDTAQTDFDASSESSDALSNAKDADTYNEENQIETSSESSEAISIEIEENTYREENPTVVSYLYGLLSKNVFFKCINRFEGCHELLVSKEVQAHETQCKSTYHTCFLCKFNNGMESGIFEETPKIPGYEIVQHVKREHLQSLIEDAKIKKKLNDLEKWNAFYYIKDDYIFFIFLKFNRRDQVFLLKIFYIGGGHREAIDQMNGKITIITEKIVHTLQFKSKCFTKKFSTIVNVGQSLIDNPKVTVEFDFSFPQLVTPREKKSCPPIENYRRLRQMRIEGQPAPQIVLNDTKTKLLVKVSNGEEIEINPECILCHNVSSNNIFITDNGESRNFLCKWCAFIYKSPFSYVKEFYGNLNVFSYLKFFCVWNCGSCLVSDGNYLDSHEIFDCKNVPAQKCPFKNCYFKGTFGNIRQQLWTFHNNNTILPNYISINKENVNSMNIQMQQLFYVVLNRAYIHLQIEVIGEPPQVNQKMFNIELSLEDPYQNYSSVEAVIANGKDYSNIFKTFSDKSTFSIDDLPIRINFIPTCLVLNF